MFLSELKGWETTLFLLPIPDLPLRKRPRDIDAKARDVADSPKCELDKIFDNDANLSDADAGCAGSLDLKGASTYPTATSHHLTTTSGFSLPHPSSLPSLPLALPSGR